MRILIVLLAALAAAFPGAVAAQAYDTPEALLEAIYAPYIADEFPDADPPYRSDALTKLYEDDAARTPPGEYGALDFDPVINGQDYLIEEIDIGKPEIEGNRAEVLVEFDNGGTAMELRYHLVHEHGGWKVDDIESLTGEYPWRLTEIFAEAAAAN